MNILNIIILALVLSLDAFSVALSISTINKRKISVFPILNGIFHFIFPIIGYNVGEYIKNNFIINYSHLITMIYILIIVEIFINLIKENKIKINNIFNILIISISVSLDSFSVGLILSNNINIIIVGLIFSLFAYLISLLGLNCGQRLKEKMGPKANLIGLILMIIVLIRHLTT